MANDYVQNMTLGELEEHLEGSGLVDVAISSVAKGRWRIVGRFADEKSKGRGVIGETLVEAVSLFLGEK